MVQDGTGEIRPCEPLVAWKDADTEKCRKDQVDREIATDPQNAKLRAVVAWTLLLVFIAVSDIVATVETGVPGKLLLALGQPWQLVPYRAVAHFACVCAAGLVIATQQQWPVVLAVVGTAAALVVDAAAAYACVRAIVLYMDSNAIIVERPPAGWAPTDGSEVFSRTVMRLGACAILGVCAAVVSLLLLVALLALATLFAARADAYLQAKKETDGDDASRGRRGRRRRRR